VARLTKQRLSGRTNARAVLAKWPKAAAKITEDLDLLLVLTYADIGI
jgi:hypothetical protein